MRGPTILLCYISGAPAPKKPKFGVKIKKPQPSLVSEPPEQNQPDKKIVNTNLTPNPRNVVQGVSKNTKTPVEKDLQPLKG